MRLKLLAAAVIAGSLGYTSQIDFTELPTGVALLFSVGKANAQNAQINQSRRVARRTSRRTSRRTNYRQSISGCSPYNSYYNCGGVYYRPVLQNGVTVYVVVNP
ncbi:hypothetical protein ACQU0X_01790 [Pseudovibrio ascidiaceicola]|jgi:hypothetical protein|uniref:hypothetical protein n=1 Tax=Pseudovibrio ascidiaceicola TaxID=285279 RepID=UPI000D68CAA5|nr:hypothetical protein [Pseudovibrio ascidiaceicola]